MGRKGKPKKISAKKERYLKFRKEKPTMLTMSPPEITEEQMKERRLDEQRIGEFWRSYRRPPQRFVSERKARSKR
jgi:hypothetical protein